MKYTYIITRILGKTEVPFCKMVGDTKKCVFTWLKDIEAKNVIHQKTGTNTSRLEFMYNSEKYICLVRRVKN